MTEHAEVTTEAASREVTITRLVDAPRDLVFKAWTEAEHIARWWGPEGFTVPDCDSDPRPGGSLRIVMRGPDGVDYLMTGVYREVAAPERLVVEAAAMGPDGRPVLEALNTVTFVDREGKTEITVQARAVALVPEAAPMLGGMQAGWSQSLRCLDDMLTGKVDRQIVITRMLQAPRERVFEAFTTRSQVEQWWGPDGFSVTTEQMDVRPGGIWRFTMHGPDGTDYPNEITYDVVTPPELLSWTHRGAPEANDPDFRATVAFDDMMGMTVLTMKSVFDSPDARDLVVDKYDAIEGGNQTLGRLEVFLAGARV